MSVMILEDSNINRAFDVLEDIIYDAPVNFTHSAHCHITALKSFNMGLQGQLPEFDGLKYMARWCAIFNLRNYVRRYRCEDFYRVTFKRSRTLTQTVTPARMCQALSTLKCLKYNIGDFYDEAPRMKTLDTLIGILEQIILHNMPEMDATQWGE